MQPKNVTHPTDAKLMLKAIEQLGALAKRHGVIHHELKRRSAIEPVIGHMKNDGHLGRNFLKGYAGNQANAVLTAIGHNFRLILA